MSDLRAWLAECLQTLPEHLKSARSDIAAHFEQRLEQELTRQGVLTRSEFLTQVKLLTQIEARLALLEQKVKDKQ